MVLEKKSSYKGTIKDVNLSSSSDYEMASKTKRSFKRSLLKNCHATFDKKIKFNCHTLKLYDDARGVAPPSGVVQGDS